jgi:hypothetical protein
MLPKRGGAGMVSAMASFEENPVLDSGNLRAEADISCRSDGFDTPTASLPV